MEQVKKVVQINENDNPMGNEEQVKDDDGGGEEKSVNELSYMGKLPNEILMKVLDYLDEKQLVKCRRLSSRWNEMSSLLLQDKSKDNPKSKLTVNLQYNMQHDLTCHTVTTKPLDDFLKCFTPSQVEKSSDHNRRRRPFPFSRFNVQGFQFMDETKMCDFISTFGPQMKTFITYISSKDISKFQTFWKLLLHFAPNIQHLKINGDSYLENVILFDPVVKAMNLNDTFLKNIKKLEFESREFGPFNGFMKDLLDNTPNVQEVSCVDSNHWYGHNLNYVEVLQELKIVHLLKTLEIKSSSQSKLPPANLMKNLGIKKLLADCKVSPDFVEHEKSTTNYIYHALKSSQNTLSTLDLHNLTMESMDFGFKDISSLPNVRRLKLQITNWGEIASILQRLSQICPNTRNLDPGSLNREFTQVAPILWTGFKGLQSLKFSLFIDDEERHPLILDSEFSGYSTKAIERIQTKLNNGFSLEEAREGERQSSSISDLKDLRELELDFIQAMDKRHNLEKDVKNSLFLKILPKHHIINKMRVLNFTKAFHTGFDSDSEYEIEHEDFYDWLDLHASNDSNYY